MIRPFIISILFVLPFCGFGQHASQDSNSFQFKWDFSQPVIYQYDFGISMTSFETNFSAINYRDTIQAFEANANLSVKAINPDFAKLYITDVILISRIDKNVDDSTPKWIIKDTFWTSLTEYGTIEDDYFKFGSHSTTKGWEIFPQIVDTLLLTKGITEVVVISTPDDDIDDVYERSVSYVKDTVINGRILACIEVTINNSSGTQYEKDSLNYDRWDFLESRYLYDHNLKVITSSNSSLTINKTYKDSSGKLLSQNITEIKSSLKFKKKLTDVSD